MMLGLTIAMMELLKVHLVTSYLALAVGMRLDFAAFSLVFLSSFALNGFLSSRKRKVIIMLLANAASLSLLLVLFLDPAHRIASAVVVVAFHLRAWWLAGSVIDHEFCVTRFDEGLGAFLLALGIAALVKAENPFPLKAAVPFLAFSMLTLGIAQGMKASGKERFSKSHNAALTSSTLALSLAAIGVAGIVPLTFLPAKKAGALLGSVSLRLLAFIGTILEWLFRARKPFSGVVAGRDNESIVYAEKTGEEIGTSTIFMWVIIGIFCVGALLLAGYLLTQLFRYLMTDTKPPRVGKRRSLWEILATLLRRAKEVAARLWMFARSAANKIAQRHIRESEAISAYRRLIACGRIAGVRLQKTDTPKEYARRLAHVFPAGSTASMAIIDAVEKQAYGDIDPDDESENSLRAIAHTLRSMDYLAARRRFEKEERKRTDPAS